VIRLLIAYSLATCLVLAACREAPAPLPAADAGVDADRSPDEPSWPLGTPEALDIGTWNIENFPLRSDTVERVAEIIAAMDLDLLAVQEIADVGAFQSLLALLPEYESVLSTHTYGGGSYQKIGFLYRRDLLFPDRVELLFENDTYAFPRPPMQVHFAVYAPNSRVLVLDFTAIVVHLKAGGDDSDRTRRRLAVEDLDEHVRRQLADAGDEDVILLGDFNEAVDNPTSLSVWAPFTDAPNLYQVRTMALSTSAYSYVPFARLIDHVVTTRSLDDELAGLLPTIPPLHQEITGYLGSVSDHLPVVTSMPGLFE
jgi:exonuclease III